MCKSEDKVSRELCSKAWEVHFNWKVSFGAQGLSVFWNSEIVHYSRAENLWQYWLVHIDCCLLYSRDLLLGVTVNGVSTGGCLLSYERCRYEWCKQELVEQLGSQVAGLALQETPTRACVCVPMYTSRTEYILKLCSVRYTASLAEQMHSKQDHRAGYTGPASGGVHKAVPATQADMICGSYIWSKAIG